MGKYYPRQSGTTEQTFEIGAGTGKKSQTIDTTALTQNRTWVVPDSDGSSGYLLSTNGAGGLGWVSPSAGSDQTTPYYIPSGIDYTVNVNKQALYAENIVVDGNLIVDGDLLDTRVNLSKLDIIDHSIGSSLPPYPTIPLKDDQLDILVIGGNANVSTNSSRTTLIGYDTYSTGYESTVIGVSAGAGNQGTAIGRGAYADGGGVAIGFISSATNFNTAIGIYSRALGSESFANGFLSIAAGTQSIAIGTRSLSNTDNSIALGAYSTVDVIHGISIGTRSYSSGSLGEIAIGLDSNAYGSSSLSIGTGSSAQNAGVVLGANSSTTTYSVVIGSNSTGRANSIVLGSNIYLGSSVENAIVIGTGNTNVTSSSGIALGANVTSSSGIALGANTSTTTGISFGSNAIGTSGISIGPGTRGTNGIAIGSGAGSGAGISIGTNTLAAGNGVGIGNAANVATNSVSIGQAANAQATSVSIGATSKALAQSVAVGYQAGNVSYTSAVSIGYTANAGSLGTSIGWTAKANGGVAVGYKSGSTTMTGIAIGGNAIATSGIALGGNATSSNTSTIVIGNNLVGSNAGLYISPIREDEGNVSQALYYNTTTKEVTNGIGYGNANVAVYLASNTDATISSINANIGDLWSNISSIDGNLNLKANISGQIFSGNINAPYIIGNLYSSTSNISIGAPAGSIYNVGIGNNTKTNNSGVAIGVMANAYTGGVSIGYSSRAEQGVSIGRSSSSKVYGIAIGENSSTDYGIAIGYTSYSYPSSGIFATTIGHDSINRSDTAILIGDNGTIGTNADSSIILGGASTIGMGSYQSSIIGYNSTLNGGSTLSSIIGSESNLESNTHKAIILGSYLNNNSPGTIMSGGHNSNAETLQATLRVRTSNATPTELLTTSTTSDNYIALKDYTSYVFTTQIIGTDDTDYYATKLDFVVIRGAGTGTTAIIGTPVKTVITRTGGASTWDVNVTADTSFGRPAITVTGQAGKDIHWGGTLIASSTNY